MLLEILKNDMYFRRKEDKWIHWRK